MTEHPWDEEEDESAPWHNEFEVDGENVMEMEDEDTCNEVDPWWEEFWRNFRKE